MCSGPRCANSTIWNGCGRRARRRRRSSESPADVNWLSGGRGGPHREPWDDIGRKLGFRGLEIHEIPESRARDAASRMTEEAVAISAKIPEKSVLVALDERGDSIDSAAFARHLGRWRDESVANTFFLIGGADGLSPDLRRKAKLKLAFGAATWPHQSVRVMLLEQIYRAATILAGHPYHRA